MDRKLHPKIIRMAKREGMENNRFGFFMVLVREGMKRRARKPGRSRQELSLSLGPAEDAVVLDKELARRIGSAGGARCRFAAVDDGQLDDLGLQ